MIQQLSQAARFFRLTAIGLLLAGAVSAQAPKNEVVATIGTKSITTEEFNRKYNEVRSMTVNPPTKAQFLEDLVRYEVGLQEAAKKNIDKDPIVQERVRQEVYKALLEKELSDKVGKIAVTDKEIEEYYKKNPEVRASHILIEVKPGANNEQRAEARKRAEQVYDEVRKSKRSFEELVRLYSEDNLTKTVGGDVGYQSRITLGPGIYDALLAMKTNEIRGLIETQYGFHIVKLTGKRTFENANKRQLRAAVFDEKRKVVFDDYFKNVKKNYTIKVNPSSIN